MSVQRTPPLDVSPSDVDLVLSSGLFAVARHLGVVEALEARGITPHTVVGTSSGAVVGALWLAGVRPGKIAQLFTDRAPLRWFSPNPRFWQGVLSPRNMAAEFARHLPATFEELGRPFVVGVMDERGAHRFIDRGPLVEAVVASCAIPRLVAPVRVEGERFSDGGTVDRLGIGPWLERHPGRRVILHEVQRSLGKQPAEFPAPAVHIKTGRVSATLFGAGAFYFEKEQARTRALAALCDFR